MKALIIEQEVSTDLLEYLEGHRFTIRRILIPEINNTVIFFHNDRLHISEDLHGEYKVLKEVDISDALCYTIEIYGAYIDRIYTQSDEIMDLLEQE